MLLLATYIYNRLVEILNAITTASSRPAASAAEVSRYPFFHLVICTLIYNSELYLCRCYT